MKSVTCRDDKAILIAGISLVSGALGLFWLLFFIVMNESNPWWMWAIISLVSGIMLLLIGLFIAMLIGVKSVISEPSLVKITFGKKKEILKKDILLITEEILGKGDCFYVVYPKGYESELIDKHKSPYTDDSERTKMVQNDKRLLIFRKTKRIIELLERFDYTIS